MPIKKKKKSGENGIVSLMSPAPYVHKARTIFFDTKCIKAAHALVIV